MKELDLIRLDIGKLMNKYINDNRFYHKNVFLRLLQYSETDIRGYSLPVLPIVSNITVTSTIHVETVCTLSLGMLHK